MRQQAFRLKLATVQRAWEELSVAAGFFLLDGACLLGPRLEQAASSRRSSSAFRVGLCPNETLACWAHLALMVSDLGVLT